MAMRCCRSCSLCCVAHSKYFTFRFTFTFAFAFELEFTFEFSLVLPWHFRVLSALPAAACCMPQRMLHLLHVVTAFMAKWLAGHGHLACISLSFWVSCIHRPSSCIPPCTVQTLLLQPTALLLLLLVLLPLPFAVACHVQAIRMFQKCFRHGPLFSFWFWLLCSGFGFGLWF